MSKIVQINDEIITEKDFIAWLKLKHEFPKILENVIKDKITVHAAKKRGLSPSLEEQQKAANSFRLALGRHRARDTHAWLDNMGISLDQFENFILEQLLKDKMIQELTDGAAIEEYFNLNSPRFDTVDIYHIIVDNEDKAKEIAELLKEDPESLDEIADEIASDHAPGNLFEKLTDVYRNQLNDEIGGKIFRSRSGDVLGPFQMQVKTLYEVIVVININPARLGNKVRSQIAREIYENWLRSRVEEHTIS